MKKILFISVKPEFVKKIFDGSKTIELRKSSPKAQQGDYVIIYSTFPVMSATGICRIKEIIKADPKEIWKNHELNTGLDKKRFFEYYASKSTGIGIVLKEKRLFKKPIALQEFRKQIKGFQPPQTYRYIEESILYKLGVIVEHKKA